MFWSNKNETCILSFSTKQHILFFFLSIIFHERENKVLYLSGVRKKSYSPDKFVRIFFYFILTEFSYLFLLSKEEFLSPQLKIKKFSSVNISF